MKEETAFFLNKLLKKRPAPLLARGENMNRFEKKGY